MPERIYQSSFLGPSRDVTPPNFKGFEYKKTEDLGRHVREVKDVVYVRSPEDAASYLMEKTYSPFDDLRQEEMWVLLLNTRNRVTHEVLAYRGTVNEIRVRGSELFREAIRVNAPALILSHCHPSGDPEPSTDDVRVTREIHRAAKILDIDLLDHICIGKARWVSMRDRGLGFEN